MMKKTVVISLGGSIIVPQKIQVAFLKRFKDFILKLLKENYKIIIVAGGGATARQYQSAAEQITNITDEDKDWIGIHATRINAHLLRTIFKRQAYPVVLDSPHKTIKNKPYKLYIASGWVPGFSTDYDAVLLAKRFGAKKVINASNIDYVYDKDISEHKDAKPIKKMTWKDYRKLVGPKWKPGMNAPFDPIAARAAEKSKMKVVVANGTNIRNLENIIKEKNFKGTILG
ncbi:MAG: UMP kinase [Candidatus Pacebacteria bacterium]|jgi:uridylate kinase|nr:UMP kinase [Candidatus Paceibacterota bacterium]